MSRTVTVKLTVPQAEALWYAAVYLTEVVADGDGMSASGLRVTETAKAKIRAAIDGAASTPKEEA